MITYIVHIDITDSHIRNGVRGTRTANPVALAIGSNFNPQWVYAGLLGIMWQTGKHTWVASNLPLDLAEFLRDFDAGKPVPVREYEVEAVII